MTDIIDKLRFLGTGYDGTTRGHRATLMNEAANVIEALRTENERLRACLAELACLGAGSSRDIGRSTQAAGRE